MTAYPLRHVEFVTRRKDKLNQISLFLVTYMNFLWRGERFKFEKSIGGAGNAGVYISSEKLRIFIVRDKGQLFLDMQPAASENRSEWFSVDLVYQSLTNAESRRSSVLDSQYVKFIETYIDDIEQRFDGDQWKQERVRLRALAKERSKRILSKE